MEYETLTGDEIRKVIAGEKIDSDDTPASPRRRTDQRDRHPEDQAQGAQGRPGTRGLTDGGGLESRRLRPFLGSEIAACAGSSGAGRCVAGRPCGGPWVRDGCGGAGAGGRFRGGAVGVDGSATMLAEAEGQYARIAHADIADWAPTKNPALIFSNAALHWLPTMAH